MTPMDSHDPQVCMTLSYFMTLMDSYDPHVCMTYMDSCMMYMTCV